MRSVSFTVLLALSACDAGPCPPGAHPVTTGDIAWCEAEGTDGWRRRWTDRGVPLPDLRPLPVARRDVAPTPDPDPAVSAALPLDAPVGPPRRVGNALAVPLHSGLAIVDPDGPSLRWMVTPPAPLRPGAPGQGLATATAWTAEGDLVVTRPDAPSPSAWLLRLGARPSPPPRADDLGAVYVDAEGSLRDTPYDATRRTAPPVRDPTALALAGDRLFVGTISGALLHWDRPTGRQRWQTHLGDGPIGAIAVPDWRRVVVLTDAHLIAVDFSTGDEVWRAPLPPRTGDRTLDATGGLAIVQGPDRADAFGLDDGTPWPLPWADGPGRLVAFTGDTAIRADRDRLLLLRADGPWLAVRADPGAPPLVEKDRAWLGTRRGRLLALRPTRVVPVLDDGPPAVVSVPGLPDPADDVRILGWTDPDTGARRVALAFGPGIGAIGLEVAFPGLTPPPGNRTRDWAPGWTVRDEAALAWPDGLVTVGRPGNLRDAWRVGPGGAVRVDPSTIAPAGIPTATHVVRATWEGSPGPRLAVFDEGPRGYLGFTPRPPPPELPRGEVF